MTFNDIFKSSFLESVSEFSLPDTLIGLAAALVIGLFIFLIYKKNAHRRHVLHRLCAHARRPLAGDDAGDNGRHLQRGALPRHGRRALYRPLPRRHQGAGGDRFPLLVAGCGHRDRRGHDPAGRHGLRHHRRHPAALRQPQGALEPLYPRAQLRRRGRRDRRAGCARQGDRGLQHKEQDRERLRHRADGGAAHQKRLHGLCEPRLPPARGGKRHP